MKKNPEVLFYIISGIVGIVFATIGIVSGINNYNFKTSALETTGRILGYENIHSSKGGTTYAPVIKFKTKDNEEITFTVSSSSSFKPYSINQQVSILYSPTSPENAMMNNFTDLWLLSVIFGGVGLCIVIGLTISLYIQNKRAQMITWLQRNWQPIDTKFTSVNSGNIVINGQRSMVIASQWLNPADNQLYRFTSENIWFDPSEFIKDRGIKVYIDPKNPKNYYMDISFLPKVA